MDLSTREGRRILGQRVRAAAKDAGLSIEELANRIGCSRALVYQYVSGASLAQPDRLQQIGDVVGKPLSWFFEDGGSAAIAGAEPSQDRQTSERRLRERIATLRELASAYAKPPDWRGVADTCQQIIPLLQHEDERADLAEMLFMQANALIRLNEYGQAKNRLHEAGALFREQGLTARAMDCLQSVAHADLQLGRTRQAMLTFQQIADEGEWRHRWQGTVSIAAAHEMQGDYTASADALVRAQEIIAENKDPAQSDAALLYVDGNWANLELGWGDYERAVETARRCVATAQRLAVADQYLEGVLSLSAALLGQGRVADALSEAELALGVAQLTRDQERWSLALASRSVARTACLQTDLSIVDAKEALGLSLRYNARRAEVVAQRALALAYLAAANYSEAQYHIDQALAAARSDNLQLPLSQFLALRARLHLEQGRPDDARSDAQAAIAIADLLGAKPVLYDCRLALAMAAIQSNPAGAAEQAQAAIELARAMESDWLVWHPASIRAQTVSNGHGEADSLYADALRSLATARMEIRKAAGADMLPTLPAVIELWTHWAARLGSAERHDDLAAFLQAVDWPALSDAVT